MKLLFFFALIVLEALASFSDSSSGTHEQNRRKTKDHIYCNDIFQLCANNVLRAKEDVQCFAYQGCVNSKISAGNDINCKGFQSCQNAKISARKDVYCTGEQSCYRADKIKTKNGSIFCESIDSCSGSKLVSNNQIECSGKQSCNQSDISAVGDIYCSGVQSCFNNSKSVIQSGNKVLCAGDEACSLSRINASNSIRCSAEKSCFQSVLNTNESYIYCDGRSSCSNAAITTAYLDCSGDKSCYNSTLIKIGEPWLPFFCIGQQACEYSTIYSAHYLWNDGRLGLANSNIYGAGLIGSTAEYGLQGAYIDTVDAPVVEVYLVGYYDGHEASLICRKDSFCTVYCNSINSCEGFTVYCMQGSACLAVCKNCNVCPTVIKNVTTDVLNEVIADFQQNRNTIEIMEMNQEEFDANYILENIRKVKKLTTDDHENDANEVNSVVGINAGSLDHSDRNANIITYVLLIAFLIVIGSVCYYGFYRNDKNYMKL